MAMNVGSGNREQDEQQVLQQMLGGGPVSQTQPVGQPAAFAPPPEWSGNRNADVSRDTPAEAQGRADAMAFGMPTPAMGDAMGGGGQSARDTLKYSGTGAMSGFNTGDYGGDLKARNSVKNTFGRIASRYKNAPSSIDAILADPDFQRYFPGAKKVAGGAGDKIDFGGVLSDFESGVPVGVVDVLQSADPNSDSAAAWAWMDEANDGGGAAPGVGAGMTGDPLMQLFGGGQPSADALGNSDVLGQILAELQAAQTGGGQSDQAQQVLQSLLAGR